jgi:hypothetical protein
MELIVVVDNLAARVLVPLLEEEINNPESPVVEVHSEPIVDLEQTTLGITFEEPTRALSAGAVLRMVDQISEFWQRHEKEKS